MMMNEDITQIIHECLSDNGDQTVGLIKMLGLLVKELRIMAQKDFFYIGSDDLTAILSAIYHSLESPGKY